MRRVLAAAALVAGAALTVPATPASAVCTVYLPELGCHNECTLAGIPYRIADDAVGGKLPDFECAA